MRQFCLLAFMSLMASTMAFLPASVPSMNALQTRGRVNGRMSMEVPLELEGQLDPSRSWDVKLTYKGEVKTIKVSEGTCILEAAETEWDAPCSCRNGICTTCSGKIEGGKDAYIEAVHGLSPEQSEKGYVLTCQTYVKGPGLEVKLGMYDEVYEQQYGKFEKEATAELEKKKAFNFFG